MKKLLILSLGIILSSMYCVSAQSTYRLDAVTDAYTTPDAGKLTVKRKGSLPRMADNQTKLILRFDPFFFSAENENVTPADIVKAEVVIVSVLEGGLTGTSRRVHDGYIDVFECNNTWKENQVQPEPFELGEAIASNIYYPGMGANDGTERYMTNYETPTRIDITEFFKTKMAEDAEFSINFIKSADNSAEFTRMGGVEQKNDSKKPRIEITYNSGGVGINGSTIENSVNIWSNNNKINVRVSNDYQGDVDYSIYSVLGNVVENGKVSESALFTSNTALTQGIYIVKVNMGKDIVVKKVSVK